MAAMSLRAAADLLGVSVRTIRRDIADGRLKALRVRSVLRVDGDEFVRYRRELCLSANVVTAGKSGLPLATVDDLNARCRAVQPAPTRSTRKLTFGASR